MTPRSPAQTGKAPQYGGQAVIEGVMMRSPHYFAVACRRPDGQIVVRCEEVDKTFLGKVKWLNRPFLRGTFALLDSMVLGVRALKFSANVQVEDQVRALDGSPSGNGGRANARATGPTAGASTELSHVRSPAVRSGERLVDIAIGSTIVVAIAFGVGLFVVLPTLATDALSRVHLIGAGGATPLRLNLLDGVIRIGVFLGYITLISCMGSIRRVFMYHGAEHKAINTMESGMPLTTANAMEASRIHPRCGTSFVVIVLVTCLVVFAFLPRPPLYLRLPMHICVIPLIAGLAYEVIRFAGNHRESAILRGVLAPGLWTQYLTTRPPMPDQVEVAIAALDAVIAAERESEPAPVAARPSTEATAVEPAPA